MKIAITITRDEISKLIQLYLKSENMDVDVKDIKYSKDGATVMAEATMNDAWAPPKAEEPAPPRGVEEIVDATEARPRPDPTPPPAPPRLETVEGGRAPANFEDVLRESNKLAATREGKFPTPKQHSMLEGESYDPPNWEKP